MHYSFKDWIDIISKVAAAIGIVIAALSYRNQTKTKRSEWLKELFEKFYESDNYKEVRKWVDFDMLDSELAADSNYQKEEKLTDFLNFFEFIATLEKLNQLSILEIQQLFAYYLEAIRKSARCMQYVNDYGFKNLSKLLYNSFTNEK